MDRLLLTTIENLLVVMAAVSLIAATVGIWLGRWLYDGCDCPFQRCTRCDRFVDHAAAHGLDREAL